MATSEPEITNILSTDLEGDNTSEGDKETKDDLSGFPRPVDLGEGPIPPEPEKSDSAETKGDADVEGEKKTEEAPKPIAPVAPAPVAETMSERLVRAAGRVGISEAEARSFGTTENLIAHMDRVFEDANAANQNPALDEKLLSLDGIATEDIDDNILKGLKQFGEHGKQVAAVVQGLQQQINAQAATLKQMADDSVKEKTDKYVSELDRFVAENKSTHGELGSGPTIGLTKGSKEYEARIKLAHREHALKVSDPDKTIAERLQMGWQATHVNEIKQKAADDVTEKLEKRAKSATSRPRSAAGKPKGTGDRAKDLENELTMMMRDYDDGKYVRKPGMIGV